MAQGNPNISSVLEDWVIQVLSNIFHCILMTRGTVLSCIIPQRFIQWVNTLLNWYLWLSLSPELCALGGWSAHCSLSLYILILYKKWHLLFEQNIWGLHIFYTHSISFLCYSKHFLSHWYNTRHGGMIKNKAVIYMQIFFKESLYDIWCKIISKI